MKRLLLALTALCLISCTPVNEPEETGDVTITNPVQLKTVKADMSVYEWIEGDYADFQEVIGSEAARLFTEKGSGILYFGYDDCPYCERAVPLLNQAAREYGVTIYYIDVFNEANGDSIKEELEPLIESTFIENSKGQKVFYVPEVIGIKNGEIVDSHVTLVDKWSPKSEDDQMSDEQKTKLLNIYKQIIRKTAD